jgi:hypothetical protein
MFEPLCHQDTTVGDCLSGLTLAIPFPAAAEIAKAKRHVEERKKREKATYAKMFG